MGKAKHRWALLIVLVVIMVTAGCPGLVPATGDIELEIQSHNLTTYRDYPMVEGIVKNTGEVSVQYPRVEVKFYDAEGNILRIDSDMLSGDLDPGETWAFEVIGYGLEPGDVASYKVELG